MTKSPPCVVVAGQRQLSSKGSSATIGERLAAKRHANEAPELRTSAIDTSAQDIQLLLPQEPRQ